MVFCGHLGQTNHFNLVHRHLRYLTLLQASTQITWLRASANSQTIQPELIHRRMPCYDTGVTGLASQACSRQELDRTVMSVSKITPLVVVAMHGLTDVC